MSSIGGFRLGRCRWKERIDLCFDINHIPTYRMGITLGLKLDAGHEARDESVSLPWTVCAHTGISQACLAPGIGKVMISRSGRMRTGASCDSSNWNMELLHRNYFDHAGSRVHRNGCRHD